MPSWPKYKNLAYVSCETLPVGAADVPFPPALVEAA
jgi:hypothetical protein